MKLKALCMSLLAALATGAASALPPPEPMGTVTVTAKPLKDKIFVGWYSTSDFTPGTLLETKASYTYTVLGDGVAPVYPRFVTKEYDAEFLEITLADAYTTDSDGTFSLELDGMVKSLTPVKLAVSGLPSGLKYDAKTFTISGKAKNPGTSSVTVKATNSSATRTKVIKINVPNLQCGALPYLDPAPDAYVISVGMEFTSDDKINLNTDGDDWKLSVSGLPSGLKFVDGEIYGIPTKVGAYTVTFTAKRGKETQVATITLNVEPLPSWLVGKFYGMIDVYGNDWEWPNAAEVTIGADGVVKASVRDCDNSVMTIKTTRLELVNETTYRFHGEYYKGYEDWSSLDCNITCLPATDAGVAGPQVGLLTGIEYGVDEGDWFDANWVAYQDAYAAKTEGVMLPKFNKNDAVLEIAIDEESTRFGGDNPNLTIYGTLVLKFGSNGAVTPTWKGDWNYKMVAAHLTPYYFDGNKVKAWLWVEGMYLERWFEAEMGAFIPLEIPCDANGNANASDINTKDIEISTVLVDFDDD